MLVRPFSKLKVSVLGSTRRVGGVIPRPETGSTTGEGKAGFVLKLNWPVKEAAELGEKRTVTVLEAPAAIVVGSVMGTVSNRPLSFVMPVRFSVALPSLRSEIDSGDVLPLKVSAKLSTAGVMASRGRGTTVIVTGTTRLGREGSLLVKMIWPVEVAAAVEKVLLTVSVRALLPAAAVVPELLLRLVMLAMAPVRAAVHCRGRPPVLESVSVLVSGTPGSTLSAKAVGTTSICGAMAPRPLSCMTRSGVLRALLFRVRLAL